MANLLSSLARGLASLLIGRIIKKGEQDPELIAAFKALKESEERSRISLRNFCLRHPDHPKCKDFKKEEALEDQPDNNTK